MVRRAAPALLLLLALGATGCLRGRGTASEPIVTQVELEGVEALDADDIKAKLATQAPAAPGGVTGLVVRQGFSLDPDALSADRRRVEAYYQERGYYEARVEDVKVVPDGPGRARVVMRISEGKPVRVTELRVSGLDGSPEARVRLDKLPLEVGDVFRVSAYDATKAAITRVLRTTGWANAEVTQSAQVLPEGAQVTYEVKPGQRLRFGPIFIAGTSAISRDIVREQASIEVKSGEWFDESKLAKAQRRVFDLGVFAGVRVTRGTASAERGIIPVVVAVREAPFRTIRAGPELGFEATRWETNAKTSWQHRNLFGDVRKVGVDLRAGYAWLPTPFGPQREGVVGLLGLDYRQPAAIARRIDVSGRVEVERGLEPGYDFWAERVQLGLPIRISTRWTFIPSYNLEVYQLFNESETETSPGEEIETRPLLVGCPSSVCLLSYLEQRLVWDGRDDPVNTRRGYYVGLSVQEGFRIGSVGYRYLRVLPEMRGFWPLSRGLVLGARARVGALVPFSEPGEPPIVARFYGGGPLSMRGYYTRRLSPMVQEGPEPKEWVPIGGNGLFDGALELRYAISGSWSGAVFLDAGNVAPPDEASSAWREALELDDIQLATGVGLRYGTPFGPIGINVGVRLPTDLSPGVPFNKRFPPVPSNPDPSVPEHREPIVAVHITIGEAF